MYSLVLKLRCYERYSQLEFNRISVCDVNSDIAYKCHTWYGLKFLLFYKLTLTCHYATHVHLSDSAIFLTTQYLLSTRVLLILSHYLNKQSELDNNRVTITAPLNSLRMLTAIKDYIGLLRICYTCPSTVRKRRCWKLRTIRTMHSSTATDYSATFTTWSPHETT
jgi:hypothetical protein